jgi:3-oxoacyl-[acyl-carrier protein] reductase
MSGALAGKRALVTGGAGGIGRAIAVGLAGEGARVAIADRAPTGEAQAAAARAGAPDDVIGAEVDVSDEASVLALFETVLPQLGGLDILVNNAGILIEKPLLEMSAAEFDKQVGVNLRGAFLVGREAIRAMVLAGQGGRVINLASELAYLGRANCSAYCASKGGVLSMTRAWAREFAPDILVNALAPGPTDTALLGPETMSAEMLALETQNPLGRIGRPDEIAAAAVFLAGPGATFMTGQCVSPNGGAAMF